MHQGGFRMTVKWAFHVGLSVLMTVVIGCGTDLTTSSGALDAPATATKILTAVPVPPGLERQAVLLREGESLERARLTLDQILARIPRPTFLPSGTDQPAPDPMAAEAGDDLFAPPLAAQRAYLAGRQAWRERQNFRAIEHLQVALRLSPKSAAILKLLGAIYSQSGNRIRGRIYLEKAVAENPRDVDSLLILGRLLGEQGRWTDAIFVLAFASRLDTAPIDDSMEKSLRYYLGYALDHEGFDRAGITQLEGCLASSVHLDRTTRMLRQLMVLDRQRPATWQTVGDGYNRLGRPADALIAYRNAMQSGVDLSDTLVRRLVFTALRLGRRDLAVQALRKYVRVARADDVSLSMIHYLEQCGVDRGGLAAMLQEIYHSGELSSSLTLTIAQLLDSNEAEDFLTAHIRQRPADRAVFEQLVHRVFSDEPHESDQVGRLIQTTVMVIDQLPSAAQEYATILVEAADGVSSLVQVIDLPLEFHPTPTTSTICYIRGKAFAHTGKIEQAIQAFEQVAHGEHHWVTAQIELARLWVARGDLQKAETLLDALPTPLDLTAIKLRLAVFHRQGNSAEAIGFLDKLLSQNPPNRVALVVEKARLQLVLGDAVEARATLQQALEVHPRSAPLYEQLLALYRQNRFPDTKKEYEKFVLQMFKMIPHERVTRVERAKLQIEGGRFKQAETLLRSLMAEDPSDLKPLDPMLLLLARTEREAEAESMILDRLNAMPTDRGVLTVALRHFHRVKDTNHVVDVAQRFLMELFKDTPKHFRDMDLLMELLVKHKQPTLARTLLDAAIADQPKDRVLWLLAVRHHERVGDEHGLFESAEQCLFLEPPSLRRSRDLAMLYLRHDRPEKAVEVLRKVVERSGPETPLLVTLLARALADTGHLDEADEQFRMAVERFPRHRADLKYEWAMHHHRINNTKRSEEILSDLLKDHPKHAAANNALGYAWADRGVRLKRAQEMIRIALEAGGNDAAFLDSMGWVLYKQGLFKEAVVWLQRAHAAPNGDYPVILNHLGDALFRAGRTKPAVVMWRRAQQGVDQYDAETDRELEGLGQRTLEKIKALEAGGEPRVAEVSRSEFQTPHEADQPVAGPGHEGPE